jgi:hypothetical protein
MPVTELALLCLLPGTTLSSLRSNLVEAKEVMESFSNNLSKTISHPSENPTHISSSDLPQAPPSSGPHQFHFYTQHEDPTKLYILGSWPSAALHNNAFLPSAENQALLEKVKDQVEVEWMVHIELEQSTIPLDAPTLAIGQHWITPSNNAGFEEAFDDNKHHLEHFSTRKIAGGWTHEKDERPDGGERDVFVLFSGWDDVDHHHSFEKEEPERFKEYSKIIEWIDGGGFEVKHAVQVELEGKD